MPRFGVSCQGRCCCRRTHDGPKCRPILGKRRTTPSHLGHRVTERGVRDETVTCLLPPTKRCRPRCQFDRVILHCDADSKIVQHTVAFPTGGTKHRRCRVAQDGRWSKVTAVALQKHGGHAEWTQVREGGGHIAEHMPEDSHPRSWCSEPFPSL